MKNFEVKCRSFLVSPSHGTVMFATRSLLKMAAILVAVVLVVWVASEIIKNLSVITRMKWLLFFVFGKGP